MKNPIVACTPLIAGLLFVNLAHGADYYFGPSGSASGACTQSAPCQLNYNMSGKQLKAGDTVYLLGGTYTNQYIRPSASGTSSAWITFKAVDGEVPILQGDGSSGCGVEPSSKVEYVRFEGIVSRNWGSSGFSNGYNASSSKIEFINCIADGNGVNGIAFYKSSGVLIKNCIAAHNGNKMPSWSSGINLFTAGGTYSDNIVNGNVSFENTDISSNRSDGSGFILDEGSSGATFVNNIAFRNGGSCIRLTRSSNSHIINNTCFSDGMDSNLQYNDEIFYSEATSQTGAVLRNNVLVAAGSKKALHGTPATAGNNVTVDGGGSAAFFVSSSGEFDFHLVSGATTLIDQGATAEAPETDIGFDPKCIKKGSPGGASWWSYVVDYEYIKSVGGVKGCFVPGVRSGNPDIGAYEFNATAATPTTGGTSGTGGTPNDSSAGGATQNTTAVAKGGSSPTSSAVSSTKGGTSGKTSANPSRGGSAPTSGKGGTSSTDEPAQQGGASTDATDTGNDGEGGASSSENSSNDNKGGSASAKGGSSSNGTTGTSPSASTAAPVAGAANLGGCNCRVVSKPSRSPWMAAMGMAGLLVVRLRRRRG